MAKLEYYSKYNVGDKLFVVDEDRKLCPTCLCWHKHYFVREAKINEVKMGYSGVEYWTTLKLSKNSQKSMSLTEHAFYTSKEKAQKECDMQNAKLLQEKKQYLKFV